MRFEPRFRLFSDVLGKNSVRIKEDVEPPISIEDGYRVIKILVEMYNKIEKEDK